MLSITGVFFLLAFALGLLLCVARDPIWGLHTYIAVFFVHPPSRWWGSDLPDLRWALIAAAVTLVCVLFRQREKHRPSFWSYGLAWIFLLFVGWFWIQSPIAVNPQFHQFGAVLFTKYLVLTFLIYETVFNKQRMRDFLMVYLCGCFYMGWLAFNAAGGGRLEGVGGPGISDANTMSMVFATGLVIGSMLLMSEKSARFWLVALSLPFLLNGLVLGGSRGAFLGVFAGGLCIYWLKPKLYRRQFYLFAALGAVAFVLVANDYFWERISTIGDATAGEEQMDASARSRIAIIEAQWEMFLDHPLGAGHRGTAALSPNYIESRYLTGMGDGQKSRASHNLVMSMVVDHGIPGILVLLVTLVWVRKSISHIFSASDDDPAATGYVVAISAALMVAFVAGQFSSFLKAEIIYWLLGLLLAARAMIDQQQYQSMQEESSHFDSPDKI